MDRLGRYALLLALALAVWRPAGRGRRAAPAAAAGGRERPHDRLRAAGRWSPPPTGRCWRRCSSDDFTLRYVAENSSRATPTFFKVLSLWAADDGSLLLWNLILAGYLGGGRLPVPPIPARGAARGARVMYAVAVFYLLLVSGPREPFATLAAPPDGRGPTPLLQNHPLMAVHPPFLYLGFIGFTVPFAFAIAGLVSRRPAPTAGSPSPGAGPWRSGAS